ncbi:MFS transporter [Paenibacillus oceani]|uniref:MFS transporter n=1 Tax=Paenibacillus oceani TaxID=2772510 RepID=A0A927C792_9BACL|nr:MFS transporter [Paenibacillus oceani]MBD2860816.1 MFS transporter [Paenibacillus oceani]
MKESKSMPTIPTSLLMLTAICMGAFLSHFTAGVIGVSLPQLTGPFQAEVGEVQWITTGCLLVITILLPFMGKLGDRYGHRLIHNSGYVLFTVSSVLAAMSPSLPVLLTFRIIQAAGAAMFQATNIALITVHMPHGKKGQALGYVSTAVALGAMTGPLAGGWITGSLGWRWLFLIHVPAAAAATLLALRYIPGRSREHSRSGDTGGKGSLTGDTGRQASLTGVLLHSPGVLSGLLISCAAFLLANTVLVVMPFYFSGEAGISPAMAGYMMTAYPILLALASPAAGRGSDRFGSAGFIAAGLLSMTAGIAILALALDKLPLWGIAAVLALIGAGMGLIASPNNSLIMRLVPAGHTGAIGGWIAFTRNAGMVLGAFLGFGALDGGAGAERYSHAFGAGILVGIAAIGVLGYGVRAQSRKRAPSETGNGTDRTLIGDRQKEA